MGMLKVALAILGVGILVFWNQQRDPTLEMRSYRFWKPWPELPTRVPPYSVAAIVGRLFQFAVGQVLILVGILLLVILSFAIAD